MIFDCTNDYVLFIVLTIELHYLYGAILTSKPNCYGWNQPRPYHSSEKIRGIFDRLDDRCSIQGHHGV
jgi:hypothetical protein